MLGKDKLIQTPNSPATIRSLFNPHRLAHTTTFNLVEGRRCSSSSRSTVLGLQISPLLSLDVAVPQASSIEFGLGDLQLSRHLLDLEGLVGIIDGSGDGCRHTEGSRRHGVGWSRVREEAHAARVDRLFVFRLNNLATTADGCMTTVRTSTLDGLAGLDAFFGLVDAMEATFFAAAEAGHYNCQ